MGKHDSIDELTAAVMPFRWPTLPSDRVLSADLRGAIPAGPTTSDVPFAGQTWHVRGPVSAPGGQFCSVTTLSIDGQDIQIWAQADILETILRALDHAAGVTRYPADTHPLIVEHLTRPLLEKLAEALKAETIRVTDHRRATAPPTGDAIGLSATNAAAETHQLLLSGPTKLLMRIAGLFGSDPVARRKVDTALVPFSCTLMGQDFDLSHADLAALQPDDVLVLDAAWLDPDAFRLQVSNSLTARTTLRDGDLRLTTEFQPMKRTSAMPAMPAPTRSLEDLPVTVSIELAHRDLTLADLNTLSVGDVVAFDDVDMTTVRLAANGRTIATGILVKVDDQIAIRLTEIA